MAKQVALWVGLSLLVGTVWAATPQSLFPASKVGRDSGPEGVAYELGTVFRAARPGKLTQLRVYALGSEVGEHTARVWRNADNALIGGPYTWDYAGRTGWITLDVPDVTIAEQGDYTVSISTAGGGRNYPIIVDDLRVPSGNGADLSYPANAGVFSTTLGARPTEGFQAANYLRDLVFLADADHPPTEGPVQITEFMADNASGLRDDDGDLSDWVELYNPSGKTVALDGYQLTAGAATWTFPSVTLGAQEFLVVFASGKNRTNAFTPLHTNFQLDRAGEYLALRDATHQLLTELAPEYPPQHADYSAGLGTNGTVVFYRDPTPGDANGPSFDGFVEDISFSVKRGFFNVPQAISLTTATPGATIRYTLNGASPTETNGTPYVGPLTVSSTTTLRAAGFKPGFLPTKVHTHSYLFLTNVIQQTVASAQAYGWPAGPINGQELRLGIKTNFAALYSSQQILAALQQIPSFSVVTDQRHLTDPNTGIYVVPSGKGVQWERPMSIELLNPDGSDGFQEDAGFRIRGGQSSNTAFPKHSFHLFFSRDYGAPKLKFPLFGTEGADQFDTIDLRCEHGYAYADPYSFSEEFTAVRDVYCRDLWASAGYASTRSRPYHLYLNGQYWGLYASQERAQEDYGSTYFGGAPEEYDVIKATGIPELVIENAAGNYDAWRLLWNGARAVASNPTDKNYFALLGRNEDGSRNPALPVLLDPQELAAYMLVHYYTESADSPLSVSFNWEKPNNFRAIRRHGLDEPFHFFVHDAESSMRAPEAVDDRANAVNLTSPNRNDFNYSNPEWIHEDLLAHPDYRSIVADEAQRLLFNGGAFTAEKAQPIWDALVAQIDQAVIGESIRWGRILTKDRQSVWANKVAQVRTNFFPTRTARVIGQLRTRNQYPSTTAPLMSRYGGFVPAGFNLFLTNTVPGGTLYYSFNGEDPRLHGGGIDPTALVYTPGTPITITAETTIKARIRNGSSWSAVVAASFYTAQDFTKLLVTEIMYHPPDTATQVGDDLEFLELKNVGNSPLDLSGVRFSEAVVFTFTNGTILAPGQFFVLGRDASAFSSRYPGRLLNGVYSGKLNNGGEVITLTHPLGGNILSFDYKDSGRWPITPGGFGFSLVPRLPNANPDPGNPLNWRASAQIGGSPGKDDPSAGIPPILVNEVLTHPQLPGLDAIELLNPTSLDADLGGWFLSDDPAQPKKFRIPEGTGISAGGYRVFAESAFNADPVRNTNSFSLNASGDEIYLFSADASGNLTGYSHGFSFGAAEVGVSFGRHVISTGDEHFVAQKSASLNASNSGPRVGPVVIKQIMYHPIDLRGGADNLAEEFVEIANISSEAIPLFDASFPSNTWRLGGGVSFSFPTNLTLAAGGTLAVVGFNPSDPVALAAFRSKFVTLANTPTLGPWVGHLDNTRDTLTLDRPDAPDTRGVPHIVVDEVSYRSSSPWPPLADGAGGSLQRLSLSSYGDDPIHWTSTIPLTINTQPVGASVRPGSNVVFTVAAAGTGSLLYQWRLNGTNLINAGHFSGADSSTLKVTNIDPGQRGDYTVLVTDASASASSLVATLTVLVPPTVIIPPQSATVVHGDLVTLSVLMTNTATLPLTYEWRLGNAVLLTNVVPSISDRYSFVAIATNLAVTNNYRVLVKNAANPSPGSISTIATIVILPDSDGDHIPDDWEVQNRLNPNDAADGALDSDGDGVGNAQEYTAGTDPHDPSSYLALQVDRAGGSFVLKFDAVAGRSYTILMQEQLNNGPWLRWVDFIAESTNRTVTLPPLLDGADRFYRLLTPQQPQ